MNHAQAEPLRRSRILVVEDDIILALDMERSLRNAGAEVFGPVKTVADANALAKIAPLTCAVLDVNLGSELVFPAAHILKERNMNTILCTDYGDLDSLRKGWLDARALTEPFRAQLLIRTVQAAHQQNGRI